MVSNPIRRAARGFEAHSEVREGLKGPPEGPGGVGKPTLMSGRSRVAHPEVQEGSRGTPEVWEGSGDPPGGMG